MTGDDSTSKPNTDEPAATVSANTSVPAGEHTESRQSSPKSATNRSFSLKFLLLLAVVLLVIIVAGVHLAWQQWQIQQQRLEVLETEAAKQSSLLRKLSLAQADQLTDHTARLNTLSGNQQQIQQRLDSYASRVRALAGTSRDDWLLAEARYLVRLASQRLLVERSTGRAQALLESADRILQAVEDPGIQSVRDTLANDIIALKLVEPVDRQGLYARLSAVKAQLRSLSFIPMGPGVSAEELPETVGSVARQPSAAGAPEDEPPPGVWYQALWQSVKKSTKTALGKLSENVRIEYHDSIPEPWLPGEQQARLLNSLLLMVEQAKFAMLHEEAEIYHLSLQQAGDWWQAHFTHYPEYEVIHRELQQLQQATIIQAVPSISGSIAVLTDYIDRFHRLNKAGPTTRDAALDSSSGETLP